MFPIEVLARIADFLPVKDYLNISIANRNIHENIVRYSEFPLPMSSYQRKTYDHILSLVENPESDKRIKEMYHIPFIPINIPLFNCIMRMIKDNKRIMLIGSEKDCEVWTTVLQAFAKNKVKNVNTLEDLDENDDRICIIVIPTTCEDIKVIENAFSPSLCVSLTMYPPYSSQKNGPFIFSGTNPFQAIRFHHDHGMPMEHLTPCLLPFPSFTHKIINQPPLMRSLLNLFKIHDKITFIGSNNPQKEAFMNKGYSVFSYDERDVFDSIKEGKKALLLYRIDNLRRAQIRRDQINLSGVIVIQAYGTEIPMDIYDSLFPSSSIDIVYYHAKYRNWIKMVQYCASYDIIVRLTILGFPEDPFIKFVRELNIEIWKETIEKREWSLRRVVFLLYSLYLKNRNEESCVGLLLNREEIEY